MGLIKLFAVSTLIFGFCYLYFSYIGFYNFIGAMNLQSPFIETSLILENPKGTGSVKYVALGDSLSAGVGSWDFSKTFVYRYALKLSGKYRKVNLINLSHPGDTTLEVIDNQVPQVIAEKPDYITLLIGVNDIHNKRTESGFQEKYRNILNELITKTDAQITVINIPYLGSSKIVYPPFDFLLNFRTKQFNKIVTTVVSGANTNNRIQFKDLYKNTYLMFRQNPNYYSLDLFHPSDEGYLLWSQIINAD